MKFRCLMGTLILIPQFALSAEMLYRQSFETPIEANKEIEWSSPGYPASQAITEHMPRHGAKSVRGNFNSAVVDPITKMKGEPFTQFKIYFKNIPGVKDWYKTTDSIYVSWWWKLDECTWKGTDIREDVTSVNPLVTTGKYAYIRMNENPTTSYYFTMKGGKNGEGILSANNDEWIKLWQDRYRGASMYLDNKTPHGSDGFWHKLSFYIGKDDKGSKYIMWWMDDILMRRDIVEPEGKFKIYDGFIMDSIQFWIARQSTIDKSIENGSVNNFCNGWQIDDVQIWNDIPVKPVPPKPTPSVSTTR